jgi:hypothetical protein
MTPAYTLSSNEQKVFDFISGSATPVTLSQIAITAFPQLSPVKGNSWARNSLRKLRDVLGIVHKVGKGTYIKAGANVVALPIVPATIKPQPTILTEDFVNAMFDKVHGLSDDGPDVTKVKNLDCTYYNDCMTIARNGDWPGFGCKECQAYVPMEVDQRVSDMLTLNALDTAAENAEKEGCAGRKRGVKPGADAKVKTRKLRVIQGEGQTTPAPEKQVA